MRTASRSSTPQEGAPSHKKAVAVTLLNKEQTTVYVDAKGKVQDVFNQVCDYLGLRETEYFGLSTFFEEEFQFLNGDDKLGKCAPKAWKQSNSGCDKCGQVLLTLHFRVQFYVDSVSLLRERVTRHQYYLQLRENLLNYGQPCSDDRYFLLASYALQADLGKYNSSRHADSYFDPREYFPAWIVDEHGEDYAQRHMPALHEDLRSMSKAEAQLQYIREASTQPCHFNLHLYRLKKKKNETPGSIWLGICAKGIEIYEETSCTLMGLLSTFLWPDIGKLYFDKKKFEIRSVGSPENRKSTYYTGNDDRSKYLLALCRNTHMLHMAMQPKLMEIQNFEIEDRRRYQESYIFSDSSDLAWEQEQSLVQGSLSLHDYNTLPGRGTSDNRTSVISNTSSNTTSGIVSDRMHISFDESEDDREGEIVVDEGRSSRESNTSAGQIPNEEQSSSLNSCNQHSPTNSESGRSGGRSDMPLTGPPLPPRLYDTKTVPSGGSNLSGGSASSSPHGSSSSSQVFKRSGSGSSHGSRASTHSAKNTQLQTVQERAVVKALPVTKAMEKEHDYEHIYENLIPRTEYSPAPVANGIVSATPNNYTSQPMATGQGYSYQPNNIISDRVYALPATVPALMPADHKLVVSKPRMGIQGIATVRSGPVTGSGSTNQTLPNTNPNVTGNMQYRYTNGAPYTGATMAATTNGTVKAQPVNNLSAMVPGQSQIARSNSAAMTKPVCDSYERLVSAHGIISELRPRPQPPRNIYSMPKTVDPSQRKINGEGNPWTPQIQITPTHSPTNSADNPPECALHPNIDEIRDLTQNMRLPLINALCNDKSLVPAPTIKHCTCQGSQNSLNHLRVAPRPDPKRLSASYAVNSPTAIQLSASSRPMSWHSETFDLDRQLQLHWHANHAASAAILNPPQGLSYGSASQLNNGCHAHQSGSGYLHVNGGYPLQNGTGYAASNGGYSPSNTIGSYSQLNNLYAQQQQQQQTPPGYSSGAQPTMNGYPGNRHQGYGGLVPRTNYNYVSVQSEVKSASDGGASGTVFSHSAVRMLSGHGHNSE